MTFFTIGLLSWVLLEYVMHRFVLHRNLFNLTHKYHHEFPYDDSEIIISPVVTIPISALFCFVAFLLFGFWSMILCYLGLIAGYAFYEYVHYKVHYGKTRFWYFRYLKKNHYKHHFKYQDSNFGVTSPLMDYLFGTKD